MGPATPTVSDDRKRPRIDDLKAIEIKKIWETLEAERPKTHGYMPKRKPVSYNIPKPPSKRKV